MIVIKRNGTEVPFQKEKISIAIEKAMKAAIGKINTKIANNIASEIEEEIKEQNKITISQIEQLVYTKLIKHRQANTAKAYEGYRAIREYQREHCRRKNKPQHLAVFFHPLLKI